MPQPRVAVVGASRDRRKFGNKAVRAFLESGYEVFPINPNEAEIEGLPTYSAIEELPDKVDLVSMYVPPKIGVKLLPAIARHAPGEVWLNPGSADHELLESAAKLHLRTASLCSIVALGRSPGEFPDA